MLIKLKNNIEHIFLIIVNFYKFDKYAELYKDLDDVSVEIKRRMVAKAFGYIYMYD